MPASPSTHSFTHSFTHSPILVVAAVPQELAAFQKRCPHGQVRTLITGMGHERAYKRVSEWLKQNSCRSIVATGYAGAAQPGLKVGDILLADEVMEARSQRLFRPTLREPSTSLPVRRGRLVTLERIAWMKRSKERLGSRFQALGLDLETAAVAAVAQEAGVGWMAVRVVLDPMEENLFSARIFRRMGIASARLADYLENVKGEISNGSREGSAAR